MSTNPLLEKLGYGPSDRVLMIHVDDLGMTGRELDAFIGLRETGLPVSGSAMVPCDGIEAVAAWASENPEADLGVHLTLTAEWDAPRWAPLTEAPSLRATDGCFHRAREALSAGAVLSEIEAELTAQVKRAIALGIEPTHLDSHMYVGQMPWIRPTYLRTAERFGLIPLLFRDTVGALDAKGFPVFDHRVTMKNRGLPEDRLAQARANLDALEPGLSMMIIHPVAGDEATVTPDWQHRCHDYAAFRSTELRRYLADTGIQLIDYRAIRAELA